MFTQEQIIYLQLWKCMEYCCHVLAGSPSWYLEYTGLLVLLLMPLLNSWIIVEMQPVFSIGRCSSELVQPVPLPYSQGRFTHYSDRLHDFPVTIPRCYKDVYVNSFFPCIARLWNSLPIECFPLTYDLNGFKSGINRHLLTVGSFFL